VNALYIIPILAILILVHEIGHFVTARLVGIKVEEFGIGLPPRLFGIRRNGIIYSINLIPLGGFVRVLGEDGKSFDPGSMQAKSRLQRTLFISAGSLMNFLLAFVLMTALVGIQGEARMNVYVSEVQPDSPAQAAGWQSGDRFLTVAGKEVTSVDQVVAITEEHAGQPMPVTLLRNGQTVETEVVPRENPPPGSGRTAHREPARGDAQVVGTHPCEGVAKACLHWVFVQHVGDRSRLERLLRLSRRGQAQQSDEQRDERGDRPHRPSLRR